MEVKIIGVGYFESYNIYFGLLNTLKHGCLGHIEINSSLNNLKYHSEIESDPYLKAHYKMMFLMF